MQACEKNASSGLTIIISCLWLTFSPGGHLALDEPSWGASLRGGKFGQGPSMHQSGPVRKTDTPFILTGRI